MRDQELPLRGTADPCGRGMIDAMTDMPEAPDPAKVVVSLPDVPERVHMGELPANVTRTESTTTIEVVPRMAGCDEIRFVVKNDGTGGARENKRGTEWVPEKVDRDLTVRK